MLQLDKQEKRNLNGLPSRTYIKENTIYSQQTKASKARGKRRGTHECASCGCYLDQQMRAAGERCACM